MTLEEVATRFVEHFNTQRRPSVVVEPERGMFCKYRYNGLKCAAGIFITDEEYNPDMEGNTFRQVCSVYPIAIKNESDDVLEVIRNLQAAHDNWAQSRQIWVYNSPTLKYHVEECLGAPVYKTLATIFDRLEV